MNPAQSERLRKEKTPSAFCSAPKCLWRLSSGPCRNHGARCVKCRALLPDVPKYLWNDERVCLKHFDDEVAACLNSHFDDVNLQGAANAAGVE